MKKTHLDTDEFWVIGDFLEKVFAKWGGDGHGCYIDSSDPAEAERFSTYREAQRFMRLDEDAAERVKEHGGRRFAKPLRCRKSVIVYPPGTRP